MTATLIGAALALGLLLIILGLAPRKSATTPPWQRVLRRLRRMAGLHESAQTQRKRRLLLIGLGAGALAWALTGWVVLIILVPLLAIVLPPLLGRQSGPSTLAKLTALETWCRSIAGLMASRRGLESAIYASLDSTPAPIRPAVADLTRRLSAQMPLERALRAFADDIDDPLGDTIAAAIIAGSKRRAHRGGGGTAAALDELAHAVAEEVTARSKVELERTGPRWSARIITIIALAAAIAGFFSRTYMAPYATATGQIILLALGLAYAGCLIWIRRITAGEPAQRLYQPVSKRNQRQPMGVR